MAKTDKTITVAGADVAGDVSTLTPKQAQAVAALLTHPTIDEAAKAVGVSDETVRRWLKMPHFATAVNDAAREKIKHAATRYAYGMEIAANVLIEIASDETVAPAVRVQAARSLTEAADTVRRLSTLEDDVAEIKEMLTHGD